jgi:type I restriction enzyme S subunit
MIPQGYKQTEIGVIQQDWNVHTLEMLYNITSSKRVFQSQWRKSGIPFYRAREIAVMSEGKSAPEDLYIDADLYNQYTRQYGSIKKDDVLITGVGTLGKVYVVKESDKFYFKDGNIIWLQFKDGFSSQYLKHQYDMPVLINQVFGNAGGSTVATYTITNAKSTKVPVPPLYEQERIAEALSDVDSMISLLE